MPRPQAGTDYPGSYAELPAWFPEDEACLDYLDWLRWGEGFSCPACSHPRGWELATGRRECAACGRVGLERVQESRCDRFLASRKRGMVAL